MRAQTLNLILEKTDQVRYYTNMNLVFDALSIDPASYDWYVSDIETNYYGSNFPSEDRWISGSALKEFLAENDVQFIWAVFSAFPIGVRVEVIDPPYIEDNCSGIVNLAT